MAEPFHQRVMCTLCSCKSAGAAPNEHRLWCPLSIKRYAAAIDGFRVLEPKKCCNLENWKVCQSSMCCRHKGDPAAGDRESRRHSASKLSLQTVASSHLAVPRLAAAAKRVHAFKLV